MRRDEFAACDKAPDSEHDWIETSTVNDAGERFICKWCSREAWEPMQAPDTSE